MRHLIGVAGRIMRSWPYSVNKFFPEKRRKLSVWPACEQLAGNISNNRLFRRINRRPGG